MSKSRVGAIALCGLVFCGCSQVDSPVAAVAPLASEAEIFAASGAPVVRRQMI